MCVKITGDMFSPCYNMDTMKALDTLRTNADVIAKIVTAGDAHCRLNTQHMISYLNRCDIKVDDVEKLRVIHVSGTKGKGSTCAFCESILRHHGYKTGMFSSPHLVTIHERFRLNGNPVSEDLFCKCFWEVYNKLEATKPQVEGESEDCPMPDYFSFLTVMACHMFLEEDVDVAIFEVGMGGEYDSTNFLQSPVVCGVTSLGLDHTEVLGDTIDKIAWHKAGIFKRNVPAVTVMQPADAMMVLFHKAREKGASLYVAPPPDNSEKEEVHLGMAGRVQRSNAALALQLCRIWLDSHDKGVYRRRWVYDQSDLHDWDELPRLAGSVLSEEMRNGLSACYWPGRNHTLSRPGVTYYMDGAHTLESVQQCMEWFQEASKTESIIHEGGVCRILIFNVTKHRNVKAMLSILKPLNFDGAVFCPNLAFVENSLNTPAQTNRKVNSDAKPQENREIWDQIKTDLESSSSTDQTPYNMPPQSHIFPCVHQALCWAGQGRDATLTQPRTADLPPISDRLTRASQIQILITGSLYLVGGALELLKSE